MKPAKIGIFSLAMINVAAIISLKNFPVMAEYGLSLVLFLLVSSLIFFTPTSLVSAELATTYPQTGGVYLWVKKAMGDHMGFVAIWLQWIENVIWYPTILSFAAGSFAYAIHPALSQNKLFMVSVILVCFWGFTLLNFLGMKASGLISSIGAICGTLVPGVLILALALGWVLSGNPVQISWGSGDGFSLNNLILFTGVLLALAGMEMSAVHAQEVKNPQKEYPRAILLSALIILILSVFGSLAIAIVVPKSQISLVSGVMQAFSFFFKAYNLDWLTPIIALLAGIGALAMVSTWIVGPSKGLMATAHNGDLPPIFQKRNDHNVPTNLLLFQAAIVSVLALVFLLMPTINSSYWILSALTAQLYLIMYILMFLAAIILRKKDTEVHRPYKAPGLYLFSVVGILASLFSIVMGFIPPKGFEVTNALGYVMILLGGIVVMLIVPYVIMLFRKPSWENLSE